MKRRKALFTGNDRVNEINVSPLIDIVFILLIFFIVTAVFVEETGVQIQRPQATSAIDLEKNSILVAITAEGKVVYDGQEIGVNGVRGIVKRLIRQDAKKSVIIQTDKAASVDLYTKVHDQAALAGAKNIHLATIQ
jgi:biopolymer transport protein ExbD